MASPKKKVDVLQEFRNLNSQELQTKVADLRKELVEQHRANKAGELPSAAAITKTRKSIAKALTVLAEKAQAEPQAQEEQEK